MAVFTSIYPVHTYEVDPVGKATFPAIFGFLQDSVAEHATKIGYGLDDLRENANMWVLSRFLYRSKRVPLWRETLRIDTWPSGTERIFALRDWLVTNEAGEEIGIGTSSWVVVDIEKRTPVRVERIADRMDMIVDRHLFDRSAAKVAPFEHGDPSFRAKASFADMDLNEHVNSTRYVEWMFEGLPSGFREQGNELVEIEINFNGESLPGDELLVFTQRETGENLGFLHGVTKSDGTVVCRARTQWRPAVR